MRILPNGCRCIILFSNILSLWRKKTSEIYSHRIYPWEIFQYIKILPHHLRIVIKDKFVKFIPMSKWIISGGYDSEISDIPTHIIELNKEFCFQVTNSSIFILCIRNNGNCTLIYLCILSTLIQTQPKINYNMFDFYLTFA